MWIGPYLPTVTLSEVEIELPALAARYAEAIGEPVEVMPTVRHRAVAVFVRNEPWERVMRLTGDAVGFRIARKDGRLRMEATRFDDLATLERTLNKRSRAFAVSPSDARIAFPLYFRASEDVERELGSHPSDPTRLSELVKKRDALSMARTPQRLVLSRFLKRGGRLPLGKTVLFRFGDYVSDREFAAYTAGEEAHPAPHFVAVRMNDQEIEVALDPEAVSFLPGANPEALPLPDSEERISPESASALAGVPWSSVAPPVVGPLGGYRIGDVLEWIHRATRKPCVGAAPRISLPRLDSNLVDALATGPVRIESREGAFIATTKYGDGLWPFDLKPLESESSPTLAFVSAFSVTVSPIWDALLSREYGSVVSPQSSNFNGGLPLLRMLGSASPEGIARLRREERIAVRSLDPTTASALERFLTEDASPIRAVRYAERQDAVVTLQFSECDAVVFSTKSGWKDAILTDMVEKYPQAWKGLPPEFVSRAPGRSDAVSIFVADGESGSSGGGVNVIRSTGVAEPLIR